MKHKLIYHKIISLFLLLSLVGFTFITGCISSDNTNDETINVVATIIPQKEMINAIGKDYVEVTIMVPAGESPHSYEPTPEQIINIAQASAYFMVGSGVEFELTHLETIQEQNPDLTLFDCSKNISLLSFDEHYGKEKYQQYNQTSTENQEPKSQGTDPHIWTSPINFKKMAETVYEGLIQIDPNHQQEYQENYEQYISKLRELHNNITTMLKPYPGESFMVYHPSWGYFSDTYQLKQIAIEEEGKQPGIKGIEAIIEQAQKENISVIFVSPQFDTSSAETIAEEINGEVASVNPLMTNYTETLRTFAEIIAQGYSTLS